MSIIFQSCQDVFLGRTVLSNKMKCLAQRHNTATLVKFEPCNKESGTLPTELTVLPNFFIVLVRIHEE